ncbi:MAG: heavy-metal-associated domain-containing protein [Gammaproteobacteria bacterium]|nr:heavy-metal-associated domain-containing protein [Gammaproteobacteria bacterium]MCW9088415.1 heavy-metal-associated domain-containing protein [Gammaproteobacteria bacterium]
MSNEQFTVQNVKCGGCVSAIENGLKELAGVESVEVTIEGGQVTVTGASLSREAISDKLKQLGYPEV